MAIFDYRARDAEGVTVAGVVEAPSIRVAQEVLQEKQFFIISIRERKRSTFFQTALGIFRRVPRKDVVLFARQLAVMISATVPIVQALRILVKQTESINFKIIISEIADEVDGGAKLSSTLSRYPGTFSSFFVNMIRSGETTGKLDETLNYLADQQEKDYDLISKLRGSMVYPGFVLGGMLIVGTVMMIFVVPRLTEVIVQGGGTIPLSTRILIGASNFLQHWWWTLLVGALAVLALLQTYRGTETGKRQIDRIKVRLPIFGQIFQKMYLVRFSRSLATLITSGVPVVRALEIVADVVGDITYHDITHETIKEIEAGNSIATAFVRSKDIPPMLPQMMVVGEQTGKLDLVLEKLANFYTKELDNLIVNLTSLIEPVILVLMGVGVGIMVTAILLPMYNLSQAISFIPLLRLLA